MVEMVHDRVAAGETTVVSTAAVLRCGKQMEKLPHYNFFWTVSLSKTGLSLEEAMDLSRDRQIEEEEIGNMREFWWIFKLFLQLSRKLRTDYEV
jgi:hypothetical protein